MSMRFVTADGKYHIESHGNGWAYEITDQATGDSLWFQDSDACEVQKETQDFENTDPIKAYFECLQGE
jgi:hypothetical protein